MRLSGYAGWFAIATAASLFGCGSGLSAADAKVRCDQERASKTECVTDASYNACLQCEEQCGDSCQSAAACPERYACQ